MSGPPKRAPQRLVAAYEAIATAIRVELEAGREIDRDAMVQRFLVPGGPSRATIYRRIKDAIGKHHEVRNPAKGASLARTGPRAPMGPMVAVEGAPETPIRDRAETCGDVRGGVVSPFDFEGVAVRVVTRDGEPWFVLADVCAVLGLDNVAMVAKRLDDDEKEDGVSIVDPMGRPQKATAINESGLYSTILTSRKPEAKRFKKWVTGTVLPAIRRNGGYVMGQEGLVTGEMTREEYLARAVLMSQETIAEAQAKRLQAEARVVELTGEVAEKVEVIRDLKPKAEALDIFRGTVGSYGVRKTSKEMKMGERALVRWLKAHEWARHDSAGDLVAYRWAELKGWLEMVPCRKGVERDTGLVRRGTMMQITPSGQAEILLRMQAERRGEAAAPERRPEARRGPQQDLPL